jgi:arginyl-tRNA synthetase
MFEPALQSASDQLLGLLEQAGLPQPDRIDWNPIPFAGEWGFGTAALFKVAAAEARSKAGARVAERAIELAELLVERVGAIDGFSRVAAERGYINLYLKPADYARQVVDSVLADGPDFGRGAAKTDRVMVEYAQPNTHHSFHIGHARNALLGESLARIMAFAGYETVRASYPGDVGLGVIKCIWAYQRFHQGQEPAGVHERGQWLAQIYTEANQLLAANPDETPEERDQRLAYDAEVRQMYQAWDAGDPEIRELWSRTRAWSLDELEAILALLDIDIDVYFYESEVDEQAKGIVDELIEAGIAEDERPAGGPVIVKIDELLGLEKETFRTAVLLRNDGTTLYLAKDLALAKQKFEDHQIDRSIYVVDVRQSLHLQQAFKILNLYGYPQAEKCFHLAYGFVSLPEGAMSSRAGNVVLFMDVLEETQQRVQAIIGEKNPDLPQDQATRVASQVAVGSLAYSMLAVDNLRDTVFDWDRALDFDGQAAPYIQYAHVRACSILRRAEGAPALAETPGAFEPAEITLLDRLSRFPDAVERAAGEYKPLIIANYVYDLAKEFTDFYQNCPVLTTGEGLRSFRLRLTDAARQTLENGLRLLAIAAPEVM